MGGDWKVGAPQSQGKQRVRNRPKCHDGRGTGGLVVGLGAGGGEERSPWVQGRRDGDLVHQGHSTVVEERSHMCVGDLAEVNTLYSF